LYNLAVLISGSGTNLQAIIDAVENGDIPDAKVALVISDRSGAYGLERAEKHGIANMEIDKNEILKLLDTLKAYKTDGIVLAGYLSIVPMEIIAAYSGKIINIHPALLPMFGGMGYYGIKVHQAVLASGVRYTGATAHIVDGGVDTGAVLVQGLVPVLPDDTAENLQQRVLKTEHGVLVHAVKALVEGTAEELIKKPKILSGDYADMQSTDRDGADNQKAEQSRTDQYGACSSTQPRKKKILIIGSGGREHAIGWKLKQNPYVTLCFAPGNGGTAEIGDNINIKVDEINNLANFARAYRIDLTIVGPELPLTLGVADEFNRHGLRIFGPGADGAMLEGSKAFAKQFMNKYGIPTAQYDTVLNLDDGLKLLERRSYPLVVKADGLAAGKGVIICADKAEAEAALKDMLETGVFGTAGSKVVIEEFLTGREVSLLCFTDSKTILPMETASDYKRALDRDAGANTGGMGSISPSPFYTPGMGEDIARRTLEGIKAEGFDYRGVIYIGLILTPGGPKVLEYNARFGDPETQALLPRLESDLNEVIEAVIDKRLSGCELRWKKERAVSVVMTSEGYPGAYSTGFPIEIPTEIPQAAGTDTGSGTVFHAGTKITAGKTVTDGGRVLAVTALGESFDEARRAVYKEVDKIKYKGRTYRSDIGLL